MSTRIGRFIFEDDLAHMSIEKLDALAEACAFYKKQKLRQELVNEFTELNLRADALGFDLCYVNPDDPDDKYILGWQTFCPVSKNPLPDGSH